MPAATIVIPLLRQRDEWLRRAVSSALAQTDGVEIIVVISPLTPASNLKVLEEAADAGAASASTRLVVTPRTGTGFPNAINTGIQRATTDRVGLLLSDDWLDPEAVSESRAVDADIVGTGATRFTAHESELPHLRRPLNLEAFAACPTLEAKASYLTHFLLFRKAKLEEIGGLDETLGDAPGIDDYELLWTLLERGATVGVTARPLYRCRIHGGERLTMRDREEQLKTLERIFDKHDFHGELRALRLRDHARWFGRPEDVVWEELHGPIRS